MFKVPNNDKRFSVDNSSSCKGNIYSTFNIDFDTDAGRIKLNRPMEVYYSSDKNSDFQKPISILQSTENGSSLSLDTYVLTVPLFSGYGGVWSMNDKVKLAGNNAPSDATDNTSDMVLYLASGTIEILYVSSAAGVKYVLPTASAGTWTIVSYPAGISSAKIMCPFYDTGRLYLSDGNVITSMYSSNQILDCTSAGSYKQVGGMSGVSCMRASSRRIWYACSSTSGFAAYDGGYSRIYEWDGVSEDPLNVYKIETKFIQSMAILNDLPVVIDGMGRLWFYDGNTFITKENIRIPVKHNDVNSRGCIVHRNGMTADRGKLYILVGPIQEYTTSRLQTERGLCGIWCYDPEIGIYHYSSPDNVSLALATGGIAKAPQGYGDKFMVGYVSGTSQITRTYDAKACSRVSGVAYTSYIYNSTADERIGYVITPFMESQALTNMFNLINVRFRKMIDSGAKIEVKYRDWKNVECYSYIVWSSGTTFTAKASILGGTDVFATPVAVGDEIMVLDGANAGLIAHISSIAEAEGTMTCVIDRTATETSGNSDAIFNNWTLLKTITKDNSSFRSIRIGKPSTMIQAKVVMEWAGDYDELQEISIPEIPQETI